mmetsp:Transcript_10697/g.43122  ORF Transcript_10697/g.43122 Transcript_10697/m.43122 type:complete len:232 (-) Transcript_10697:1935-2630(-)
MHGSMSAPVFRALACSSSATTALVLSIAVSTFILAIFSALRILAPAATRSSSVMSLSCGPSSSSGSVVAIFTFFLYPGGGSHLGGAAVTLTIAAASLASSVRSSNASLTAVSRSFAADASTLKSFAPQTLASSGSSRSLARNASSPRSSASVSLGAIVSILAAASSPTLAMAAHAASTSSSSWRYPTGSGSSGISSGSSVRTQRFVSKSRNGTALFAGGGFGGGGLANMGS